MPYSIYLRGTTVSLNPIKAEYVEPANWNLKRPKETYKEMNVASVITPIKPNINRVSM